MEVTLRTIKLGSFDDEANALYGQGWRIHSWRKEAHHIFALFHRGKEVEEEPEVEPSED